MTRDGQHVRGERDAASGAGRRPGRNERGAVAVEFALLAGILAVMLVGALEFGLLFRLHSNINAASRAGVRAASTLARLDTFKWTTADAVQGALSDVSADEVDYLMIYKVDPATGRPSGADPETRTCTSSCIAFRWNPANRSWVELVSAGWNPVSQEACGDLAHTDEVGVYVEGHYAFISGLFGVSQTVSEASVMRFEPPQIGQVCK